MKDCEGTAETTKKASVIKFMVIRNFGQPQNISYTVFTRLEETHQKCNAMLGTKMGTMLSGGVQCWKFLVLMSFLSCVFVSWLSRLDTERLSTEGKGRAARCTQVCSSGSAVAVDSESTPSPVTIFFFKGGVRSVPDSVLTSKSA